jgi:7-cyano-7-deazaguanine synthase
VKNSGRSIESALVLLSGGLDSTVALAIAEKEYRLKTALFFDYNQCALKREKEAAGKIAEFYGLRMEYVELPWLAEGSSSSLIRGNGTMSGNPADSTGVRDRYVGTEDVSSVWVENRNGIFLNIAAAFASWEECSVILTGFNREESILFPDNSREYIDAVNKALDIGEIKNIRIESPTVDLDKKKIVKEGIRLSIPWELLWSCYGGGRLMCGKCESCLKLKSALVGTGAEKIVSFSKEK